MTTNTQRAHHIHANAIRSKPSTAPDNKASGRTNNLPLDAERTWIQSYDTGGMAQLLQTSDEWSSTGRRLPSRNAHTTRRRRRTGRAIRAVGSGGKHGQHLVVPTAGVAILVNPRSTITDVTPWQPDQWTTHWMTITCTLLSIANLPDLPLIVGGDVNACRHAQDRSHGLMTTDHRVPELMTWEERWELTDTLSDVLNEEENYDSSAAFASKHHTYHYNIEGQLRSARLDRWYTTMSKAAWVNAVEPVVAVAEPDHLGSYHSESYMAPAAERTRHTLERSPFIRDLQPAAVTEFLLQVAPGFMDLNRSAGDDQCLGSDQACRAAPRGEAGDGSASHTANDLSNSSEVGVATKRNAEQPSLQAITKRMANLELEDLAVVVARRHGRIVTLRRPRSRHMAWRRRARYWGMTADRFKTFFARFSVKYAVASASPLPEVSDEEIADAVEQAWRPIMSRHETDDSARRSFLQNLRPRKTMTTT
ncbi:TPA: LOW QUALITY PROTEIN: hypothetical protein N0F65_000901 [Lagenidium giganteum]|uniref:Endonuclease/exonuclease/phosphatase domain-containing protein n=1 Tax=Lagenidium giganteum TaxID=4803 RepID=A0AAV2Z0Y6_9STRA|nr:TPA: LOW QUALITY PROTEIN: hypothetical protein N0F65_000901 [Lagenidium giganteum]